MANAPRYIELKRFGSICVPENWKLRRMYADCASRVGTPDEWVAGYCQREAGCRAACLCLASNRVSHLLRHGYVGITTGYDGSGTQKIAFKGLISSHLTLKIPVVVVCSTRSLVSSTTTLH